MAKSQAIVPEEELFISSGEPEQQAEAAADAPKIPSWAKFPREWAEKEFDRWARSMGLESKFDASLLTKEQVADLQTKKMVVIRAIMEGHLSVSPIGTFVFKAIAVGKDAELGSLTFSEPKLNDINEAAKIESQIESQAALIARMTNKDQTRILYLHNRNSAVCNAIVALFLG